MTTDRQISANRHNARLSTGPRTQSGKARSARNATRHGLNTAPPFDDVLIRFRIILADQTAEPPIIGAAEDAFQSASWRLAEADVHVQRCIQAEQQHDDLAFERRMDGIDFWRSDSLDRLERDPEGYHILMLMAANLARTDPALAEGTRLLARSSEARPAALKQKAKTLIRYRKEAEAQRRKAFSHWLTTM